MVGAILHINGSCNFYFSCRSNLDRSTLPPEPTKIKATPLHSYWASMQANVEAHLKKAIPMKEPFAVFEAMHHLVFAAPRTTVPALCVAACELVGGHKEQAMDAASALLLMQAAIYTHEHLPLADRPKPGPMIDHVYGPNIEHLMGDGIVPLGFELLARSDDPSQNNSERILRAMIEISRVMGSNGVIDGRYRKVLHTQSDGRDACHVESIKHIVAKNEGELHACGAACGAMLGGGSEEEIEKLRKFGFYVGMIQGLLQRVEKEDKELMKEVEEIKNLAFKELEGFEGRKVEAIHSFIDV